DEGILDVFRGGATTPWASRTGADRSKPLWRGTSRRLLVRVEEDAQLAGQRLGLVALHHVTGAVDRHPPRLREGGDAARLLVGRVAKQRLRAVDQQRRTAHALPEAARDRELKPVGTGRRVQRIVLEADATGE